MNQVVGRRDILHRCRQRLRPRKITPDNLCAGADARPEKLRAPRQASDWSGFLLKPREQAASDVAGCTRKQNPPSSFGRSQSVFPAHCSQGVLSGSRETLSRPCPNDGHKTIPAGAAPSLHFSPPDGRSTPYDRQDFVALACRAQRTFQVRLRAPSGARLVLTALSPTSPRHVVRNAG